MVKIILFCNVLVVLLVMFSLALSWVVRCLVIHRMWCGCNCCGDAGLCDDRRLIKQFGGLICW